MKMYRLQWKGQAWASKYHSSFNCPHQGHGLFRLRRSRMNARSPWRYLVGICPVCGYTVTWSQWLPEYTEKEAS